MAADSQASASSQPWSGVSSHGCESDRSGISRASVSGSARPAQGSSAVKRAMLQAFVRFREEVVALPWYAMSFASTLVIGLVLAVLAANLYNRPRLIFSTS